MATGTVKWFKDTYGFIEPDRGPDCFVHYTAIQGEGHRTLTASQRVTFDIMDDPKGSRAVNVVVIEGPISPQYNSANQPPIGKHTGYIKWYHPIKRYGFIEQDRSTRDVFFHTSEWKEKEEPREGIWVTFSIVQEQRGSKAIDITCQSVLTVR